MRRAKDEPTAGTAGAWATVWALVGTAAVLLRAVVALGARGVATVRAGLTPGQWAALALLTATFVYVEGVRALERRWVPRVVERARRVRRRGVGLRLAAPLHAFGLVGVPAGAALRAWAAVAAVVLAVLAVRALPEPWRGIVDLAVAVALTWALMALARRAPAAFRAPAPGEWTDA